VFYGKDYNSRHHYEKKNKTEGGGKKKKSTSIFSRIRIVEYNALPA
jgi:hypothetical protein